MNSPAITRLTLDEGPQRLWREWLGDYFDGQSHVVVGQSGVSFPLAQIGFDVADLQQPLSGVGIVVVTEDVDTESFISEDDGADMQIDLSWSFYVRGGATTNANSRYQCRRATQLLKALLSDSEAMLDIARGGITDVTIEREKVLPSYDLPLRQLRISGTVRPTTEQIDEQAPMPTLSLTVGTPYGPIRILAYDFLWVGATIRSATAVCPDVTVAIDMTSATEIGLTLTPQTTTSTTLLLYLNGHTEPDLRWPIIA